MYRRKKVMRMEKAARLSRVAAVKSSIERKV
jgi:hypothetical protein